MTIRTTSLAAMLLLGLGCPERAAPRTTRTATQPARRKTPPPPRRTTPRTRTVARTSAPRLRPRRAPPAVQPACRATVGANGRVLLGKVSTPILVGRDNNTGTWDEVATWSYDRRRVLVASRPIWRRQNGAAPDGLLWLVDCKAPRRARKLLTRKDADFGNAAATADGKTLYFTGAKGIVALSLPGLKTRVITRAPIMKGLSCPGGGTKRARDVVQHLSPDGQRLTFWRGGPCGHQHDWKACELVLLHPASTTGSKLHRPHPVTSVAVDAKGTVWLADGGRCDEPGVQDPASESVLLRSANRGKTWRQVKVRTKGAQSVMGTAAHRVLADARRPGHVVVLSETCTDSGNEGQGGDLYATSDGGKTWRRIPRGRGWPRRPQGQRLMGLSTVQNTTARLIALDDNRRCWETANAGKAWRKLPCPKRLSTFGSWTRAVKGCRYRATDDGLWRRCKGDKTAKRVYPSSTRPCAWLTTKRGI